MHLCWDVVLQFSTKHLWLHLHRVISISTVNSDRASYHRWDDDHCSLVCLDWCWLISTACCFCLPLIHLLEKVVFVLVYSPEQVPPILGCYQLCKLTQFHLHERLEIHALERKCFECSLFLGFSHSPC